MSIKVNELVKSNKLSKVSNGVNIFNAMKAEFNKNPLTRQFELDFAGIVVATPVVFQEIKRNMVTRLEGNFAVVLTNATPQVKLTFQKVFFGR